MKISTIIMFFILMQISSYSQDSSLVTDYFRSKISGNWHDPSTWESSPDNITWTDADLSPDHQANIIRVQADDTVFVTRSVIVNQVVVDSNATLIVEGFGPDSSVVFDIANGPDIYDMIVYGNVVSTGVPDTASPFSINPVGILSFEDGSEYEHQQNGGAIPISLWQKGSTFILNGIIDVPPFNRSQSYSNIIVDLPELTFNLNMGFNNHIISGDIHVINTNASRWVLVGPDSGEVRTVTLMGNIYSWANFTSHGTFNPYSTAVIYSLGNIFINGGSFAVTRGSQGGTGTTTWYQYGDLSINDALVLNGNPGGGKFVFKGPNEKNLILNNVTYGAGGLPIQVDTASLNLGTSILRGDGIFDLSANSVLLCGSPGGLDSSLQNTGTLSLSPGADYVFNGTAAQVTGLKLPDEVQNLTVNNTAGVTLSEDITVSGNLGMNAGNLLINGRTVTLGPSAMLNEMNGFVTGTSGKLTTTRILNAPSSLDIAGLGAIISSAADLGLTLIERYHSPGTGEGSSGIYRQYYINPENNTSLGAALRFNYIESELNSISEDNLRIFASPSGEEATWRILEGVVNTVDNYAEVNEQDSLGFYTLADGNLPIPVEITSFSASVDQAAVILKWSTATEIQNRGWDIERRPASETKWKTVGFTEGKGTTSEPVNYIFRDDESLNGKFQYRLKQLDYNGDFEYSGIVEVEVNNIPQEFSLHQNYPNPFNPETSIKFDLPENSFVNLTVYNSIGEVIATLINQEMEKGRHVRSFNAASYPSGIYFYKIEAGNFTSIKKMILIK
jgi:hypothetical protein